MSGYSITLNFFLSYAVEHCLKNVTFSWALDFDWRQTSLSHCTIKALDVCDNFPSDIVLQNYIIQSQKILDKQGSFDVTLSGVGMFPWLVFAHVQSVSLCDLHKKLSQVLPSSQPQFDNENYTPHVSIGTVSGDVSLVSDIHENFGAMKISEIQLVVWDQKNLTNSTIYHRFSLL